MDVSIPKQLSGPEALDSMLHEVRKVLWTNGRFGPNMAYPGYRAEITVKFYPAASFIPAVEQEFKVEGGFIGFDGVVLSETPTVTDVIEIPIRPPNKVREDSGMPTPILTQDANGQTIEKWVKGTHNGPKKNKVVGGHVGPEPLVTMVPTSIPVAKNEV
jgi:hypothetical protein